MGKFVTDSNNEWTPELLEEAWKHIEEIGVEEMGLDLYPNQFEIVGSDGMLEAYASTGLPINYQHWSFGKTILGETAKYKRGDTGLAYEMVINSNPCINYLMEENTLTTQMLVMAHAGCVSGDTEYLSPTGWKPINTYSGDLVTQYHEDGTASFVQPINWIKVDAKELNHVVSDTIDQMITDNHTVVYVTKQGVLTKTTGAELVENVNATESHGFLVGYQESDSIDRFNVDFSPIRIKRVSSDDGHAYCFTVPTGMLILRRNGKISVTGNCGHNFVFKNNDHFRQWTMADYIIDYMKFAKSYIAECEEKYGWERVETILDAAHALQNYSVDKYQKPKKPKGAEAAARKARAEFDEQSYDQYVDSWAEYANRKEEVKSSKVIYVETTENILYFIEKNAPNLSKWEREIVRIVRMIGQYFFPQRSCQIIHEGMATFTHHRIIQRLDEKGLVDSAFMLEFAKLHSGVVYQQDMAPLHNPYKLGWEIFKDIERICTQPTKEDEHWFPFLVGQDPMEAIRGAVRDFKDTSFIQQFVSPKLIRDFKLMAIHDGGPDEDEYTVTEVNDELGYEKIRKLMADARDINLRQPQIEVVDVLSKKDRRLVLKHHMNGKTPLDRKEADKTLRLMYRLWQFPVEIQSWKSNQDGTESHVGTIVFKPDED